MSRDHNGERGHHFQPERCANCSAPAAWYVTGAFRVLPVCFDCLQGRRRPYAPWRHR